MRDALNGWMVGYITLTTFTTWSADFVWNSASRASGLPAAQLWNARLRNGEALEQLRVEPGLYVAERNGETLRDVAAKHGVTCAELVALNKKVHKNISGFSKLMAGTEIAIFDPDDADVDREPRPDDTPAKVAERHGLPVGALLSINAERFAGRVLTADSKLEGRPMKLRDRDFEVSFEYLNPSAGAGAGKAEGKAAGATAYSCSAAAASSSGKAEGTGRAAGRAAGKAAGRAGGGGGGAAGSTASSISSGPWVYGMRKVDDDGSLTKRLAQQERKGDPAKEGVVWPRICELGLLVSLGGGGSLLRFALQRLQSEGWYEYCVCQATLAAVGFYERVGFVRVGAVAKYAERRASRPKWLSPAPVIHGRSLSLFLIHRYAEKGVTAEELAAQPLTGYRHWAVCCTLHVGGAPPLLSASTRPLPSPPAIPSPPAVLLTSPRLPQCGPSSPSDAVRSYSRLALLTPPLAGRR